LRSPQPLLHNESSRSSPRREPGTPISRYPARS
jgi:hypothetical protein